ncbi:MAG: HAD family hydrolase [Aestuariivirga sp.]
MRHVIFDCDGVLIDSEPLSMQVDVELLARHGVVMSLEEAHRRFVGHTFEAMMESVARETGIRFPTDLSAQKDKRLMQLFERELKAVDGVADVLRILNAKPGIASNSPRDRIVGALDLTGLTPFFEDRITTFEDVARPKPAPDVFLAAAARAETVPELCIVVEDSATGVSAAKAAGCHVLGFTGTHAGPAKHAVLLKEAGADAIFETMAGLPALLPDFIKPRKGKL